MDDQAITLDVSILGREYRIACKEYEREELLRSVQFLDRRMREIRDTGKVSGAERIAVMAALNITHELLRAKGAATSGFYSIAIQGRISAMESAIDRAMADQVKWI